MLNIIEKIDIWLFYLINRGGQNIVFDHLMPILSDEKRFYIPMAIVWLFLITKKSIKFRAVAIAIIALIGVSEFLCSDVLKPAIGRLRPYDAISHVRLYNAPNNAWQVTPEMKKVVKGRSRSLPSAHATNIFAAAVFLGYYFRRLWPLFYIIAAAVSYSRVYLGVHYPLDVFAGAVLGTVCALAAIWGTNRIITRWGRKSLDECRPKRESN